MDLYYRKLGVGNPLLILHGLFGSSDNWLTVSKAFAKNFEVFLIDLRNHGQSPHSQTHTYFDMANDVYEFTTQHNLKNITLIGHSMGGKTAMSFAKLFPSLVQNLIIVDIAPRFYPPHHARELNALQALNLSELQSRQEADQSMARFIPELGIRQFLLKNLYRTTYGDFKWRMNLEVLTKTIENIGEKSIENTEIKTKTLFLRGQNSNYITDIDVVEIKKLFKNVEIKTISDAGHWIQAEQPKYFQDAVFNFLNITT